MRAYLARRLALLIPTLLGIIALNFIIIQLAPGGPAQALLAHAHASTPPGAALYRGSAGTSAATIAQLNAQFGFNQPPLARFLRLAGNDLTFNLGTSDTCGQPVSQLIWQRLPVSLSLGAWSTLLVYLVSIPLGLCKALRQGTRFDAASSLIILALYATPSFLLATLCLAWAGQGSALSLFPLRGLGDGTLTSYAWHIALPTIAMAAGGFASLTILTKNAVLEEISKLYTTTARARGASEAQILLRHILPSALLLNLATLPAALTGILFSSALLIEIIFSLQGLGQLGYQAILSRDYPVMFGTLYVYTLTALILRIAGDLLYTVLDPRIGFARRV